MDRNNAGPSQREDYQHRLRPRPRAGGEGDITTEPHSMPSSLSQQSEQTPRRSMRIRNPSSSMFTGSSSLGTDHTDSSSASSPNARRRQRRHFDQEDTIPGSRPRARSSGSQQARSQTHLTVPSGNLHERASVPAFEDSDADWSLPRGPAEADEAFPQPNTIDWVEETGGWGTTASSMQTSSSSTPGPDLGMLANAGDYMDDDEINQFVLGSMDHTMDDRRRQHDAGLNGSWWSGYDDGEPGSSRVGSRSLRGGSGKLKRSRSDYERHQGSDHVSVTLQKSQACAMLLYHTQKPDPCANDVWPNVRSSDKLPARYYVLKKNEGSNNGAGQARLAGRKNRQQIQDLIRTHDHTVETSGHTADAGEDVTMISPPSWPPGSVPTELYEEIAGYLSRDDIKSMRLVCREFDRHVSQVLFSTVVVPFNTEIYGMLGQDKPIARGKKTVKVENKVPLWNPTTGDDVYEGHGLDVFRGFGKHILRFGMSFEVKEDALAKPPRKSLLEGHSSFWGNYSWPFVEYRRFEDVAGLETAADETPRMTVAFSELSKVRELALSIDSGLGWLNGPDRSIRAQILQRPPTVFGTVKELPDRRAQAQKELWDHIESCHDEANDIKLAMLYKMEFTQGLGELEALPALSDTQSELPFLDQHLVHEANDTEDVSSCYSTAWGTDSDTMDGAVVPPPTPKIGILFSRTYPSDDTERMTRLSLAHFTKAQKEWLLETEWAQRAFLASYMISIIDNPATFNHIHTLNISRLSDRYISILNREDFWDTLPNLKSVTLRVIPGWRTVYKDDAGFVETPTINPSGGIDEFHDLLQKMVVPRSNIKQVTIGWVGGGEHAEGLLARNKHLLPPPLLPAVYWTEQFIESVDTDLLLRFPHVEHLTIENCWVTPGVLQGFIKEHDKFRLKKFTLDSVSLTAVMRANHLPHHAQVFHPAGLVAPGIQNLPNILPLQTQNVQNQGLIPLQTQNVANQAVAAPGAQVQHVQGGLNYATVLQHIRVHVNSMQMLIQHLQTMPAAALAGQYHQLQNQLHVLRAQCAQFLHQYQSEPQATQQQTPQFMQTHAMYLQQTLTMMHQVQTLMVMGQHQNHHLQVPQLTVQAGTVVDPQTVLKVEPRPGSWVDIIDQVSPGINLSDFDSEHSHADPERRTSLEAIHFASCGYAKLPLLPFDQSAIDSNRVLPTHSVLLRNIERLKGVMLSAKWPLLGEIVQEIPTNELLALIAGWDLEEGWRDAEAARGPEFDGLFPGGTGRFTGVVGRRTV